MVGCTKERGLSEVIGFLMIVSLLTILFSMYLLYVVPIQGRDAEISHMKYITQEFIGLKADIDGLIINNKINLPIARSFELGTLSSVGSGALSILPVSSFIEASGTLMVNEQNDFLNVMINGSMVNLSGLPPIVSPPISNPVLELHCNSPSNCPSTPINFTISDRYYNITTQERFSINNTTVNIAITYPNNTPYFTGNASLAIPGYQPTYDLVLQTFSNIASRPLIAQKTLIENLTFPCNLTYNLLKDNALFPNNSTDYYLINPTEATPSDLYAPHTITTKVTEYPPRIGSLQYESNNRYWVNQNLLYEMGGLFLNQPTDGGSSVMLIPSIALTPFQNISQNPDPEYHLKVSINNIRIIDTEDVSGSVSAQIFSKVDKINQNIIKGTDTPSNLGTSSGSSALWKMREGDEPNARAVWLQFLSDDDRINSSDYFDSTKTADSNQMNTTAQLWKRAFDQIKTITNKTLSSSMDNNQNKDFTGWMYIFRMAKSSTSALPYSANIVIGENAKNRLSGDCPAVINDPTQASICENSLRNYLDNPGGSEFILDYMDSEVSIVMQSGAL
ncbi:hypothetical protein [Methanospirillum lacunae]